MMPIVDIEVPAESVDNITRAIGVRADQFNMMRVWRNTVLPWIVEFAEEQFRTDGAHGSTGKWADYSGEPMYASYKVAIVGHLDLLRWEKGGKYEMLYPSLTDPGSPYNVTRMADDRFEFGTDVPHAADVASRTEGPFGEPSPAREVLAVGDSQRTDLFRDISRDFRDHEGVGGGIAL